MPGANYAEDRWFFIERIQEWFLHKDKFWLLVSLVSFGSALVLQVFLMIASKVSSGAWQQSEFLVIPLLSLFVLSIFWRSIVQVFLSFSGALMTYGGMFLFHTRDAAAQIAVPYVANRLGYGIKHFAVAPPSAIADRYFIVGMFAMAFCLAIALRPNFFKPKDPDDLPYQVWRNANGPKTFQAGVLSSMIPLSALLTYEENHLVARYRYVVVIISGTKFLATPYDWVPEGTAVARNEQTKSFIGIL